MRFVDNIKSQYAAEDYKANLKKIQISYAAFFSGLQLLERKINGKNINSDERKLVEKSLLLMLKSVKPKSDKDFQFLHCVKGLKDKFILGTLSVKDLDCVFLARGFLEEAEGKDRINLVKRFNKISGSKLNNLDENRKVVK